MPLWYKAHGSFDEQVAATEVVAQSWNKVQSAGGRMAGLAYIE